MFPFWPRPPGDSERPSFSAEAVLSLLAPCLLPCLDCHALSYLGAWLTAIRGPSSSPQSEQHPLGPPQAPRRSQAPVGARRVCQVALGPSCGHTRGQAGENQVVQATARLQLRSWGWGGKLGDPRREGAAREVSAGLFPGASSSHAPPPSQLSPPGTAPPPPQIQFPREKARPTKAPGGRHSPKFCGDCFQQSRASISI